MVILPSPRHLTVLELHLPRALTQSQRESSSNVLQTLQSSASVPKPLGMRREGWVWVFLFVGMRVKEPQCFCFNIQMANIITFECLKRGYLTHNLCKNIIFSSQDLALQDQCKRRMFPELFARVLQNFCKVF